MNGQLFNPFEMNGGKCSMKLSVRYPAPGEMIDIPMAVRAFKLYGISLGETQVIEICLRLIEKAFPACAVAITIEAAYRVCRHFGKVFFAMIGVYLIGFAIKFYYAPFVFFAIVYLIVGSADHFPIFESRLIMGMVLSGDPEYSGPDVGVEQVLIIAVIIPGFADTGVTHAIAKEV